MNDFKRDPNGKSIANELTLFSFEFKSDLDAEAIKNAILFDNTVLENKFYGKNGWIEAVALSVKVEEIR
ncbi:MAG: hypothetical protein IPJ74_08600 [Saprospiraceae bacterium]|nr:hypothetical protein [Saprospiraceae bacterium]